MNITIDQHRFRRKPLPSGEGRSPQATRRGEVRVPPTVYRAFTLAELLIVVLIISIVTVATIPFLKPALDSRRIREAARLFTSQLASAQSQAIANGNSVGVWMEKIHMGGTSSSTVEGRASADLSLCEVPDPYSGDTSTSTVLVNVTTSGGQNSGTVTMNSADTAWVGLIKDGDLIRFNNAGSYYVLTGPHNSDRILIQTTPPAATVFNFSPLQIGFPFQVGGDDFVAGSNPPNPAFRNLPPAAWTPAGWTTSFQIIRQPVQSAGAPVELPSGSIIDLELSGMGNSGAFLSTDNKPLLLMFDRSGAVECIYSGGNRVEVIAPLYFMVGRREGIGAENDADQDNIWVSVNPHTGVASTTEVATGGSSRAFAISAQAMGGK